MTNADKQNNLTYGIHKLPLDWLQQIHVTLVPAIECRRLQGSDRIKVVPWRTYKPH